MTSSLHRLLLLIVVVISPQLTWAQQVKEVSIVEPGVIKLANLFKMADAVALVKVVSGDTENYDTAVYKAEVVKSFKGAEVGEAVYFGPYVGLDSDGSMFCSCAAWQNHWSRRQLQTSTMERSIIPRSLTRATVRWRHPMNACLTGSKSPSIATTL